MYLRHMIQAITTSDRIRKDIKKIAKLYMNGESMVSIALSYKCNRKLVERIMKQMLPVDFFVEKKRVEIEQEKLKQRGELARNSR